MVSHVFLLHKTFSTQITWKSLFDSYGMEKVSWQALHTKVFSTSWAYLSCFLKSPFYTKLFPQKLRGKGHLISMKKVSWHVLHANAFSTSLIYLIWFIKSTFCIKLFPQKLQGKSLLIICWPQAGRYLRLPI